MSGKAQQQSRLKELIHRGREPGLKLMRRDGEISLRDWGLEVCDEMQAICEYLDTSVEDSPYTHALETQRAAILDPELTPSAKMLAEMRENGEGFYHFAKRKSHEHHQYFSTLNTDTTHMDLLDKTVQESLIRQQAIEAADDCSLDDYLARYFTQV